MKPPVPNTPYPGDRALDDKPAPPLGDIHDPGDQALENKPATPLANAQNPSAALAALLLALFLISLAETAMIPSRIYIQTPSLLAETFLLAISTAPRYLWPGLVVLLGIAALQRLKPGPRVLLSAQFALSTLVPLAAMAVLFRYPKFRRYVPFYLLFGGLFLHTLLALHRPLQKRRAGLRAQTIERVVCLSALPAALVLYLYTYMANSGHYPTLHLAALQVAYYLLGFGLWLLLERSKAPLHRRVVVAATLACGLIVAGTLAERTGAVDKSLSLLRTFSQLGQSRVVFHPFTSAQEGAPETTLPLSEQEGIRIFLGHTELPKLPADFDLTDYNVLLLASEATRFDQTSLAEPSLATSPWMRSFADDGAFVFTRAYSPSTGTLISMSAILGMAYPSMLDLEIWSAPWSGQLQSSEMLIQKHFQRAGYSTFWIGHNYKRYFQRKIEGFNRDWNHVRLYPSGPRSALNDRKIADAAIKHLNMLADKDRRFFGWVFLESPHARYNNHYAGMPQKTALDRYRQEIRFADEQLGRIYTSLANNGLLERTIIIYISDHGEEFLEHGGTKHTNSVYSELCRVPLLVRIPGLPGRVVDAPTSTLYVLPWLALHGPPALRLPALGRITRIFAPMMQATAGAIVVELLGHNQMESALVYPTYKVNYDFISKRHELFYVQEDPLETEDRLGHEDALTLQATEQMRSYRAIRRDRRRYSLDPDH